MSLYRPIPQLQLAANVQQPLSPLSLRDYGKLLYWIFFFPQAVRDYLAAPGTLVATTANGATDAAAAEQQVQSSRQRQRTVVLMSTILLLVLSGLGAGATFWGQIQGVNLDYSAVLKSSLVATPFGLLLAGIVFLLAYWQKQTAKGIVLGVATGVTTTLLSMFTLGELFDSRFLDMVNALGYGFIGGSGVGIIGNLAATLGGNAQPSVKRSVGGAGIAGLIIFLLNSTNYRELIFNLDVSQENLLAALSGALAFYGGSYLGQRRPLDWLWGKLFLNVQLRNLVVSEQDRRLIQGSHMGNTYAPALEALFAPVASAQLPVQPRFPHVTLYPIRQLSDHLTTWLEYNWEQGLDNADQFWRYTNQQPLINEAVHQVLDEVKPEKQVEQVAQFVDKFNGQHWPMLFYATPAKAASKPASKPLPPMEIAKQRRQAFQRRMLWRELVASTPFTMASPPLPQETVPQRAIAGFWYLTNHHLDESVTTFQQLPSDDLSKELQGITQNMQKLLNTKNLITSPTVELVERPKEPKRKATWDALDKFKALVRYGWLYHQCKEEERHEAARDMALYQLREIEKEADKIPRGDRAMILRLVTLWRREFDNWMTASRKPQRMKPLNPFIFLETLRERTPFVGRDVELKALKSIWARGARQPLLLYGLPKSGKTSFIFKALHEHRENAFVVKFNVPTFNQHSNPIRSTLRAMCEALHHRTGYPMPREAEFQVSPFDATERMVKDICKGLKPVLVLVVDNFDDLQIPAPKVAIENMEFMAGVAPIEKLLNFWTKLADALAHITFVFVAHAADFPECAFTPYLKRICIGALSEKEVLKLLNTPVPEFIPLFAPKTVGYLYHLSGGQPYLVQLLASCVTDRFNQTLEKEDKLEPIFLVEDVDAVIETEAFRQFSEPYFQRLCGQLESLQAGSRAVLHIIAAHRDGISSIEIEQRLTGKYVWAQVEKILAFLETQQVIKHESDRWQIVGELLRQKALG